MYHTAPIIFLSACARSPGFSLKYTNLFGQHNFNRIFRLSEPARALLHVSGPLPIHIGQESSLSQAKAWPSSIPKPKTQSHLSNTDSFEGILDACKILKPLQPARNRARDSSGPCAPNTPNTQPAAALANGSLRCQVSTRRGHVWRSKLLKASGTV